MDKPRLREKPDSGDPKTKATEPEEPTAGQYRNGTHRDSDWEYVMSGPHRGHGRQRGLEGAAQRDTQCPSVDLVGSLLVDFFLQMFRGNFGCFRSARVASRNDEDRSEAHKAASSDFTI